MIKEQKINDFLDNLSSSSPTPGGGGASACVGAAGVSLAQMVANLTLGKKKYADVQEEIKQILLTAESLQNDLLSLADKDAEDFAPLAKAYSLPTSTPQEKEQKTKIMESALATACNAPLEIMEKTLDAIYLHEKLAQIGSKLAISDVGVGVLMCKSALIGASLNIFINTKYMQDTQYAKKLNEKAEEMIKTGTQKADEVYKKVEQQIKQH